LASGIANWVASARSYVGAPNGGRAREEFSREPERSAARNTRTQTNTQRWSFHLIPKQATINALVSLVIDPATKDSDFPLVLYHKDQANEKDYSHEGFGFAFKKIQADIVMKLMSQPEVKMFKVSVCPEGGPELAVGWSCRSGLGH
jgi:hypothetical protein